MKDWMVSKLEASHTKVEPVTKKLVGARSSYILVDDNGAVILVDRTYPADALERVYRMVEAARPNTAAVLYKDGETFFRSAASRKHFKKDQGRSLKYCTDEEFRRMIRFRPEEILLNSRNGGVLQYYQPASARLEEGIETFTFTPVVFDYSHIPKNERYGAVNKDSKRLHIWTDRNHVGGGLVLANNRLNGVSR